MIYKSVGVVLFEMSETERLTADSEDDGMTVTTHGSESPMTGENLN